MNNLILININNPIENILDILLIIIKFYILKKII